MGRLAEEYKKELASKNKSTFSKFTPDLLFEASTPASSLIRQEKANQRLESSLTAPTRENAKSLVPKTKAPSISAMTPQVKAYNQKYKDNIDFRKQAEQKLIERRNWEQGKTDNPLLQQVSGLAPMQRYVPVANFGYNARENLWQEQAKYGKPEFVPEDVRRSNQLKRAGMYGLDTLEAATTLATGGQGGVLGRAVSGSAKSLDTANKAKTAYQLSGKNMKNVLAAKKLAGLEKNVSNAQRGLTATKLANNTLTGAVGFGLPVGVDSVEQIMNNKMTPQEGLKHTGNAALLGGTIGAAAPYINSAVGKFIPDKSALLNSSMQATKNRILQSQIAQKVAQSEAKGITLSTEMKDRIAQEAEKMLDKELVKKYFPQMMDATFNNLKRDFTSTAIDTQLMANADYGLNVLQGNIKPSMETYKEQQKAFLPFYPLGIAPTVMKKGILPVANKMYNTVGNTLAPAFAGEMANALNIKAKGLAGDYQKVDKALTDRNIPATEYFTKDNLELLEKLDTLPQEEKDAVLRAIYNDKPAQKEILLDIPGQEKPKTKEEIDAENFMNDAPSVKVDLQKQEQPAPSIEELQKQVKKDLEEITKQKEDNNVQENVQIDTIEAPISNENVSSGINTSKTKKLSKKRLSVDNEEKITKLPEELNEDGTPKVAEGGLGIYEIERQKEKQARYQEGLNIEEQKPEGEFDIWYREEFPQEGSSMAKKSAIESKKFELKGTDKEQSFNDFLKEKEIVKNENNLPKEYSYKDKSKAKQSWIKVISREGHDINSIDYKKPDAIEKYLDRRFNSVKTQESAQNLYDKLSSMITETKQVLGKKSNIKTISNVSKEIMFNNLNEAVNRFEKKHENVKIKRSDFSKKKYQDSKYNELETLLDNKDIESAEKLVGENYLFDGNKTVQRYYEELVGDVKTRIEAALKENNYKLAQKTLDKYKNILTTDVIKGYGKEAKSWEKIDKDVITDNYTITDSRGQRWELVPEGMTREGYDSSLAVKEANKLISDIQSRIDAIKPKQAVDTNKNLLDFFNKGKEFDSVNHKPVSVSELKKLIDEEITSSSKVVGENIDTRNLSAISKEIDKIISDGRSNLEFEFKNSKDIGNEVNGKADANTNRIYINSGIRDTATILETVRHEYQHIKDSVSKYYAKAVKESKELSDIVRNFRNEVFNKNDKETITNYDVVKNVNNKLKNNYGWSIDEIFEDLSKPENEQTFPFDIIEESGISIQEFNIALEDARMYNEYKNCTLEKRAFTAGEGKDVRTTLEQDWKARKETSKNNEGQLEGTLRPDKTGSSRPDEGRTGLNNGQKPLYLASSTSNYRNSVKIDLDKIKYSKYISQQDIVNLRNIAKKSEQTLIDLGVLDKERAEREKRNIGSDIYVSQKHNLTKKETSAQDYNPSEYYQNTKNDLWSGHATRGRNERVNAKDAAQNILTHAIDAKFLEKVNDITMSKFSIKLGENKKVPEDYRAVNSKLLNNLVARNLSETFLNKFEKGHQAIEEMFPDKEQADFFKDLYDNTQEKDIAVPKKYLSKLLSFNREYSEEMFQRYGMDKGGKLKASTKRVLEISDALIDKFKQAVLSSGAFIMHNREGNVSFLVQDSDNYIDTAKNFGKATKMNKNDVPQRIQETGFAKDLGAGFKTKHTGNKEIDNILNSFLGDKIDEKSPDRILRYEKNEKGQNVPVYKKLSGVEKLANAVSTATLNRVYKKIFKASQKANTLFEDYERRVAYLNKVDKLRKDLIENTSLKTITTNELIDIVRNHPELENKVVEAVDDCLGNYRTFNATEKKVFKRILPFYSWWRTLARQTLHMAKDRPQRLILIANEIHKMDKDNKDRKEFQRHAINTRIKDKRNGKELLLNVGRYALPQLDYYDAYKNTKDIVQGKENPDNLIGNTIGSINPYITKTVEGIRGKKFFGSGDIDSARYNPIKVWRKDKDGNSYTETIGYQDSKTGKNYHNLPKSEKAKYISKQLGSYLVPAISNTNSSLKTESVITGLKNNNWKLDKNFIEPDRMSDTEWFTGWKHDDIVNGIKKYVSNNSSEKVKLLNRLGLSIQPKYELSKSEKYKQSKDEYKEKSKRQRKRKNK